ncbi:MAG: co-chaperone GroES [Patescibacteria group bacterium]|nr:co-chaperone GroES [Patescibacteria group bacterium]
MKLQAINDSILVLPLQPSTTRKSGLEIPATAKKVPVQGVVLSVGQLIDFVQPGDKIAYAQYAGDEIEWEGQQYLFLLPKDIYAKLTEEGETSNA